MGASNVAAVYTSWAGLNHVPFRLLAYMALVTLDRDDPPRFWGGRDDLAHAIGRRVPREPDDTDASESAAAVRRQRKQAHEAVRIALAELKAVGVVVQVRKARLGVRAEYTLHLTPAQAGSQTPAQAGSPLLGQAGRGPGSGRYETPTQTAPEEESGLPGTLRGEDRRSTSLSLAARRRALNSSDDAEHLGGRAILAAAVGAP